MEKGKKRYQVEGKKVQNYAISLTRTKRGQNALELSLQKIQELMMVKR